MTVTDMLPPLVIADEDYGRLSFIATLSMMDRRSPPAGALLADELVRATVVPAASIPSHVVAMNSQVEFRDEETGRISDVTVVFPGDDDKAPGCISVLSPLGAALIGLSEGQSIDWVSATGDPKKLTILGVR